MTRRFLAGSMLAVFAVVPLLAQGGPPQFGPGNRLDFLAGYLSLTDAQKEQAKTIFDAADEAAQTVLGQLTSARDALRQGIKSGKTDAELDQLAAAVGTVEGTLAGINAKAEAKFYALLTAEQKTKYDQLGQRGGAGPGGNGMGPGARGRMGRGFDRQ